MKGIAISTDGQKKAAYNIMQPPAGGKMSLNASRAKFVY